jgi:nitrous oxidase accessory protein NosD
VNPVSSDTVSVTSTGKTIYVDDDFDSSTPGWGVENFSVIQNAIDNASDGDKIFVYNGLYNESIVIDKQLTLEGEDNENTIITHSVNYNKTLIKIVSNDVIINGFKLEPLTERDLWINIWSNNNAITNNNIESMFIAIFHTSNIISNNNITSCSIGIHGLSEEKADNNKITNNKIKGGITISCGNSNEISYNTINGGGIGIFGSSNFNKIEYNIIKNCGDFGIVCLSAFNKFCNNDFYSNRIDAWVVYRGYSTWLHNYWGRSRALPKPIIGFGGGTPGTKFIFSFDFDWFPAQTPNCDFGGDN